MGPERRYESGPPNAVPPTSCVPFCVHLSSPISWSLRTSQHRTMLSLIRSLVLAGRQTENVVMREAGPRDPSVPTVSEHLGLAGTAAGDQFCLVSPCFDSALFR